MRKVSCCQLYPEAWASPMAVSLLPLVPAALGEHDGQAWKGSGVRASPSPLQITWRTLKAESCNAPAVQGKEA